MIYYLHLVHQHQQLETSEKGVPQIVRSRMVQSFYKDHTMLH